MKSSSVFAFLGGVALGAAVALLLAPQSGEQTRRQIRDFAGDEAEKVKKNLKTAGQKLTPKSSAKI